MSATATATAASRCRSSRRSTPAASGSVRGYESSSLGPRDIVRQRARRQAQDRRQRRAVLSDPRRASRSVRAVGVRRRRPDLRERPAAGVRDRSASRPASGSRGTRRSARSSSATRTRSTRSPATRSRTSSSRSARCSDRHRRPQEKRLETHRIRRRRWRSSRSLRPAAPRRRSADYKIGFVNTERLFREAAPAKRAQQKLEKEFAARDAEHAEAHASRCATCRRRSTRTARRWPRPSAATRSATSPTCRATCSARSASSART